MAAWVRAAGLALWCACTALPALAHKPSDSYLSLSVQGEQISGRWDIALRDLDFALGLDANGDGDITWGELRAQHKEIAAYAQARLTLRVGETQGDAQGAVCTLQVGEQMVDGHTDGAYTVMPMAFSCPARPGGVKSLSLDSRLFADIDPQHRGLLNLTTGTGAAASTRTAVLGPQAAQQTFVLAQSSRWQQFVDFAREGVWHIWIGFDHILFLLSLLLPAVLLWQPGRAGSKAQWRPAERFGQAFFDVLRIVTAFTVAHSITLSLATLGYVALPSRLVESAIAASVVLAALNNVFPLFQGRRWAVAFLFGLIHGFGFASVLADLGLPQEALVLALVGFNLGVEAGQLAIVAVFLPVAFVLRRTLFYRQGVRVVGSLLIAALAAVWLAERVFNLKLLPF
jgi:hypothetical protein